MSLDIVFKSFGSGKSILQVMSDRVQTFSLVQLNHSHLRFVKSLYYLEALQKVLLGRVIRRIVCNAFISNSHCAC